MKVDFTYSEIRSERVLEKIKKHNEGRHNTVYKKGLAQSRDKSDFEVPEPSLGSAMVRRRKGTNLDDCSLNRRKK